MKLIETNEFLIRELDAAQKQVNLYVSNKGDKDLPEKLAGRINWLRSYAQAIKHLDRMKSEGTLKGITLMNFTARITKSIDLSQK